MNINIGMVFHFDFLSAQVLPLVEPTTCSKAKGCFSLQFSLDMIFCIDITLTGETAYRHEMGFERKKNLPRFGGDSCHKSSVLPLPFSQK